MWRSGVVVLLVLLTSSDARAQGNDTPALDPTRIGFWVDAVKRLFHRVPGAPTDRGSGSGARTDLA
jgi:hypothetical protein